MGVVSSRQRILAAALAAAPLFFFAQPSRAGDAAAAEALLGEAKKLVAQKKYAEACPKFAESNRLDRGAGTLIHLADCYEKNKQTASAWATYKEAASAAQALGRSDWEKLANKRAAALEKKLAKLTVRVVEPADGIEVTRDGTQVSQASWGEALPVDAGKHTIAASAPGRLPYETDVVVAKDGERQEIIVPKLEIDEAAAKALAASQAHAPGSGAAGAASASTTPAPPPDVDAGGGGQKTVGFIVAGVGVVGLGLGAVTGLMAIGKNNDSKKLCPDDGACASQSAVDDSESAKTLGTVSTIGFIAGGVALAAGAVLVATAGPSKTGLTVVPQAGPKSAGLGLAGRF
jgi:hypothetical protein